VKSALNPTFTLFAVGTLVACSQDATRQPLEPPRTPSFSSFANSEWSAPIHLDAPINSPFRELGAELSPDGLSLYFGSDRPAGGNGNVDIWAARRDCIDCPWGALVNININSPQSDGGPAFSPDGHILFFGSNRDGGHGGDDIWISYRENKDDDLGWQAPINLGPNVNTPAAETSTAYVPALNAAGANLYFVRGVGLAAFDIYQVRVTRDGETEEPATPVTELNSSVVDGDPTVSHDGKEVFFWSQRPGGLGLTDLWTATRQNAHDQWSSPENLGSAINTAGPDLTPGLSRDGRTLVWSAGFAARGGLGMTDIWMSTRTQSGH
jgi:hypothetical protein